MGTTKNEKEEQIKQSQLDLYWRFESANNLLHLVIDRDYDYFHKLLEDRLTQAIKNSKTIGDVTLRVKPYDFISKGWNKHILHDYEIVSSVETIISLIVQGIIGPKGKEREEWITNSRLGIETPPIQLPNEEFISITDTMKHESKLDVIGEKKVLYFKYNPEKFELILTLVKKDTNLHRAIYEKLREYQELEQIGDFSLKIAPSVFNKEGWQEFIFSEIKDSEIACIIVNAIMCDEIGPREREKSEWIEVYKKRRIVFDERNKGESPLFDLEESYQTTMNLIKENGGKEKSALDVQIGGSHYKQYKIQPIEFIHANEIPYIEASCIKYLCRHRNKNGAEDLRKVIHYCELLLELEYKEKK